MTIATARKPRSCNTPTNNGGAHVEPKLASELATTAVILDPSDPLPSARKFIKKFYLHDGVRTLHYHRGEFFGWMGACYLVVEDSTVRAELYRFLENTYVQVEDKKTGKLSQAGFKPTIFKVNNVVDALKAETNLANSIMPPTWLDGTRNLPALEIVACQNGLLHLPSLRLIPPDPNFFNINALDFDYQAECQNPVKWLAFLSSLWPDDQQAIAVLQEVIGYLLVPDTSLQKIFMFVGPKRSGKGTIGRVITALLGRNNVVAPTMASMSTNFGLQPLIGKRLAIIADARLGVRADHHAIAERLLSISGEDSLTIDRKYRPQWTGRLSCRFLILTNELPRITDASGALASRFVILRLTKSFYGQEDSGLTDSLLTELPGILNWSIAGWQRLQERGHFVPPKSSAEATELLGDLASPISLFVKHRCDLGAGKRLPCDDLFEAWCRFCHDQGIERPGTAQLFGRDLHAAVPPIKVLNLRDGDKRTRWYDGIALSVRPETLRVG